MTNNANQHNQTQPKPQPGEAWLIEYEGKRYEAVYWYSPIYAHWAFVEDREGLKTVESPEATPVSRLFPESTPDMPKTEVDYRSAISRLRRQISRLGPEA